MRKRHPFRHALLATAGTVSSIVLLLALKPSTDPALAKTDTPAPALTTRTSASAPASSAPPSASPSKAPKHRPASRSASPSHTPSATATKTASAPSAPKTTAAPTTRTVTGATVQTQYGPVQVRITLTGGRITAATAVQSPNSSPRSQDINSTAVPKLNQETLQAQSANIDTVSGATYTSGGYKQSLQSALDRA